MFIYRIEIYESFYHRYRPKNMFLPFLLFLLFLIALGEDAEWTKWTEFNNGNRVPFIVHVPGVTDSGVKTSKLTELVDLLPTLVEAAGFDPLDKCPENSHEVMLCTEGSSMVRLMEDPNRDDWKDTIFWQFPQKKKYDDGMPEKMGYSARTAEFRYTEYVDITHLGTNDYEPDWNSPCDHEELYDLTIDPQENWNR
jgi:iduronate 2-sulfatase